MLDVSHPDTFSAEEELVAMFLEKLTSDAPWEITQYDVEFDYGYGRTDIVALDASGKIVAFEAKLHDWQRALHQAYRNTCYAHRAYVLLPKEAAVRAYASLDRFQRRRIGICYLDNEIRVLHDAVIGEPVTRWLSEKALRRLESGSIDYA